MRGGLNKRRESRTSRWRRVLQPREGPRGVLQELGDRVVAESRACRIDSRLHALRGLAAGRRQADLTRAPPKTPATNRHPRKAVRVTGRRRVSPLDRS